ncbi:BQ2448_2918 [Microbotryum intermedium]|uniref:BQ2448_2918 protein n=1 Tax=Microbotryum intermedium TaxID=269621 RepID=A0A238FBV9_9BASI|nr:BQ2448_2918 [Microbotryum intermedium]
MASVYIAREDYDDDEAEQINPPATSHANDVTANYDGNGEEDLEFDEQDYEEEYEEEYDEEDYYEEEEEDQKDFVEPPAQPAQPVSDVEDSVYYDHTSLMRCWTSALSDYKFLHPSSFLPSTEAPRSKRAKHLAAPLWYGPLPTVGTSSNSDRSPSVFSTSTTATTTTTNMNGGASSSQKMTANQKRNAKKRARRDRLAAQQTKEEVVDVEEEISASVAGDGIVGGAKRRRVALDSGYDDDGPSWTPQSPEYQRDASVEVGEVDEVEMDEDHTRTPTNPPPALATRDSTRTKTLPSAAGPSLPSSSTSNATSSFLPHLTDPSPSISSLLPKKQLQSARTPTNFPPPPPIVPLDPQMITSVRAERLEAARQKKHRELRKVQGEEAQEEVEAEGEDESEQGLLQSALWAWYTAGYQTALYHSAVGVAGALE